MAYLHIFLLLTDVPVTVLKAIVLNMTQERTGLHSKQPHSFYFFVLNDFQNGSRYHPYNIPRSFAIPDTYGQG